MEHLGEFRSRVIKVAIAFFTASVIAWFFRDQIFEFLIAPSGNALEGRLNVTGVTEQLFTDMKLALYVGFLVTIPILLYQIWAFIAPAVGDLGRAFTYTIITLSSSLFLAGIAFGYFVVLPIGMGFLLNWAPDRYDTIITSQSYLQFVTRFLLAFGIVFELPAATYVAAKLGLVDAPILKRYRRHAIVVNTLLAAALTPGQDPYSMILMAVPMIAMYEVSIVVARYVNPVSEVTVRDLGEEQDDEDDITDDDEPEEEDSERDL